MTRSSPVRPPGRWRLSPVALLTVALLVATVTPAAAQEAGTGVVTGTEDQIDVADPPVQGSSDEVNGVPLFPLCARAQDGDFDGTTDGISAQYTVDAVIAHGVATATFTADDGTVIYQGPLTITIEAAETFFFGPQGTHYGLTVQGNDCGADNLGPNSPVPATIKVEGLHMAGGFVGPCSAAPYDPVTNPNGGQFWRVTNVFEASAGAITCDVEGNVGPTAGTISTVTSSLTFDGNLQPPCGVVVDCLTGEYTQQ